MQDKRKVGSFERSMALIRRIIFPREMHRGFKARDVRSALNSPVSQLSSFLFSFEYVSSRVALKLLADSAFLPSPRIIQSDSEDFFQEGKSSTAKSGVDFLLRYIRFRAKKKALQALMRRCLGQGALFVRDGQNRRCQRRVNIQLEGLSF